jgi:hypothetical protein
MKLRISILLCASGVLLAAAGSWPSLVSAQQSDKLRNDLPRPLAERILKESQAREACKKSICETARSKQVEGPPLACNVVKTWPAQDLKDKILKGRMNWTWGNAQCETEVKLDRTAVARITAEPKLEVTIAKHQVACKLELEDGKTTHRITFAIEPTVTFENGKATKAVLHWSNVDGTTLAKSALWSATAVDNTFNVLQGAVVEQINEFFGSKCDEALKK